jgi:hypothetical protein
MGRTRLDGYARAGALLKQAHFSTSIESIEE